MAVSQVFKDFPEIQRLQAFADADNMASQKVLEKAGFTREGLLRKYLFLKGKICDIVVFSLISTDSD